MRREIGAALLAAVNIFALAGCEGIGGGSAASGESVSVQAVSAIVDTGSVGLLDRYAGKVVAGETAEVKRDSSKSILKTYVEEGDMVRAGQVLFEYDTEKMQLDLDKLYLEKENLENTISSAENTIAELEKQRSKAKESEQLSYTLQIDSKNAEIRESQYNIALKERDIASMEASLENAEITSPIAGRVMSVDEDGSSGGSYGYYDDGSSSDSTGVKYITVTDVTRLRVEGNISEMNAYALTEGMDILVRSRLDGSVTWKGVLSYIDWDNPVSDDDDNYGMVVSYGSSSGDEMTTASKYPFYVELEDTEGLLMGQHVYIEPNAGQQEQAPAGPMLPGYYLAYEEDGSAYVWADDGKGKLEKRPVELGIYDETTDSYEILEGLDESDYIAFPEEGMEAGRATEKFDPAALEDEGSMTVEGEIPAAMGG